MLFNMILPGAVSEEPFAFEYSGNYTDNRDADGKGTVRFNTSGTLTVTGQAVTVSAYILGGGGGAAVWSDWPSYASGGGGGNQTIEVELAPGTYEIVIGAGGAALQATKKDLTADSGGNTTAFGVTSTGGGGGKTNTSYGTAGTGGSPNGGNGSAGANTTTHSGGFPNGGAVVNGAPENGGDGYVELTFI